MLLEMCSCYGVDEDDVSLLLDYGYSADDVEEMLCDHSLLAKAVREINGEEYCGYAVRY